MKMKTRNFYDCSMPWNEDGKKTSFALTLSCDAGGMVLLSSAYKHIKCWLGQPRPTLTEGSEEFWFFLFSMITAKKIVLIHTPFWEFSYVIANEEEEKTKVRVNLSSHHMFSMSTPVCVYLNRPRIAVSEIKLRKKREKKKSRQLSQ